MTTDDRARRALTAAEAALRSARAGRARALREREVLRQQNELQLAWSRECLRATADLLGELGGRRVEEGAR